MHTEGMESIPIINCLTFQPNQAFLYQWTYTATYFCQDAPITDCRYRNPEIFRACSDIRILRDYDDGVCPRGFEDGGDGFNCYHITQTRELTYEKARVVRETRFFSVSPFFFHSSRITKKTFNLSFIVSADTIQKPKGKTSMLSILTGVR